MNITNVKIEEPTYEEILKVHAEKTFLFLGLLGIPGLGWLCWGNFRIDIPAGFAYLPALILLLTTLALRINKSKLQKICQLLADLFTLFAIFGATLVVIRANAIGFPLTTSPIQFALILTLPFSFRRRFTGLIRNVVYTALSLLTLAFIDTNLLVSLQMHFVFGFFGGTLIQLIAEDRMYKDYLYRRSLHRERLSESRQSRRIGLTLQSRCLPQQIEKIRVGFAYDESLPTYQADFWVAHLTAIGLASIDGSDPHEEQQKQLSHFVESFHKNLTRAYSIYHQKSPEKSNSPLYFDHGFLWRTTIHSSVSCFGYPFPLAPVDEEIETLLYALLTQLQIFHRVTQTFSPNQKFAAYCSLSYGQGHGWFVGSLNNYEIEGPVLDHAAALQNARFHLSEIDRNLLEGRYVIVIDPGAFERMRMEVELYFDKSFQHHRIEPHLRGRPAAKEVILLMIDPERIEQYLFAIRKERTPISQAA